MKGTMRASDNEKVAKRILDLICHWELDDYEIGKYIARIASVTMFTKFNVVYNSAILERQQIEGVENLDNIS
jgi:hypothetical protein